MTRKKLKAICKTNLENKQPHFAAVSFKEIIIFTTKKIGDNGEKQAEEYLKKLGYKVIERNWKYSRIGEIDIIALEKTTLVFVEVKYRRSKIFGSAIEAITPKKFQKIYESALAYLSQTNIKYTNYRIDVITIDKNAHPELNHIKNVSI